MTPTEQRIFTRIAEALNIRFMQVHNAVTLIDEGATVPFIARYRKEVTEGLDDTQLRNLAEQLVYLRDLEDRRSAILQSINEQGQLTPELAAEIDAAETKQRLEDLYLPYKPKRRTKAQIAREAGIEPLAMMLLQEPQHNPQEAAQAYINVDAGFADVKAVLEGARQILMEHFAEDAELLSELRTFLSEQGYLQAKVVAGKENEGEKFRDWFDFAEPIKNIPSHRALAIMRGRNESILQVGIVLADDLVDNPLPTAKKPMNAGELAIAARFAIAERGRAADAWLMECVRWAWRVKLFLHLELELIGDLKTRAEEEAIDVFARNLKSLLLAAPAGQRVTMGLDPGIRTGVKVAVVDAQGKLLATDTIYPHQPRCDWHGSIATLAALCAKYKVQLIAIGNGTASRETDKLVEEMCRKYPAIGVNRIIVSEAGASVYSASEFAAREFPELDVSLRGAVSIARRLQDPLAELVKIDPKSIGVGQYQHDVSQSHLARSLSAVVEDCVNAVGVDINTASVPLLSSVSGLNATLAANIVQYRDERGAFTSRQQLKEIPRLGAKTFEQAAGFLRITNGENPLDASAVHPEAYPVVEKIVRDIQKNVREIIGHSTILQRLKPENYIDERFGLPTVVDIIRELEKPGRDPRPEFKTAQFADGVDSIADLRPGMCLEGVVTNVANFGAFIDLGVHQDGLAHVSALSHKFIKDPGEVVKAGDIVKVKVLEVDVARKRISLTLRLDDPLPDKNATTDNRKSSQSSPASTKMLQQYSTNNRGNDRSQQGSNALADAFARIKGS